MTTQSTMDKLNEMRLTAMSDAFRTQLDDPKMKEVIKSDSTMRQPPLTGTISQP